WPTTRHCGPVTGSWGVSAETSAAPATGSAGGPPGVTVSAGVWSAVPGDVLPGVSAETSAAPATGSAGGPPEVTVSAGAWSAVPGDVLRGVSAETPAGLAAGAVAGSGSSMRASGPTWTITW